MRNKMRKIELGEAVEKAITGEKVYMCIPIQMGHELADLADADFFITEEVAVKAAEEPEEAMADALVEQTKDFAETWRGLQNASEEPEEQPEKKPKYDKGKIREMYNKGKRPRQIAEELGYPLGTVAYHVHKIEKELGIA